MIRLRPVRPGDAAALAAIYTPYVRETAVSYEYDPPTAEEFARRIQAFSTDYPYLVCEAEGRAVGYAYACRAGERRAFDWSADLSIYLDQSFHRRGAGRALYGALLDLLRLQGCHMAYVAIAGGNEVSLAFHRACGFRRMGTMQNAGFKLGRWWDLVWMQQELLPCREPPAPFVPFSRLPDGPVREILEAHS